MTSFNSTYYTGNTPQKIPVPEDSSGGEDLFAALEHLKQFADKELLEENAKLKSELEEFQKDATYHTREKRMLVEENEQLRRENERLREQNNGASDETTIGEDCLQLGSDLTRTDIADATASGTGTAVPNADEDTAINVKQKIRMEMACALLEKARADFDTHGNKVVIAETVSALTGIPLATCKRYVSERDYKQKRRTQAFVEDVSNTNSRFKRIGVDITL